MNKYIYIAFTCVALSSCSNSEEVSSADDDTLTPILLAAEINKASLEVQNQAARTENVVSFPNSGKIVIIAANNKTGENQDVADWTDLYITPQAASTTSSVAAGEKYSFTWDANAKIYWPFNPAEKLFFAAYSPATSTDGTLTAVTNDPTSVHITLKGTTTADVLYTQPTAALNKTSGTVDLGEFQHALAKVQVIVKAVDTDGQDLATGVPFSVTHLGFKTKITTGTFNLPHSTLTPDNTASNATEFTLFSSTSTAAHSLNTSLTKECYALPGTENNSSIRLTLADGKLTYPIENKISSFIKTGSDDIKFIAGKTTVLTIKVQVKKTEGDEEAKIVLVGNLTDWNCNGRFDVTIE